MEFIQKKTVDSAVEHFLLKAAEEGISLAWDRYEGQLPECGFCETGLSCRDCLQGPCISHPFRDSTKLGVCGKDKDILASQSLLRLVIKGTMAHLDRMSDFAEGVKSGKIKPKKKVETDQMIKEIQGYFMTGGTATKNEFPKPLIQRWGEMGILPEGIARDLIKASQKLEGGVAGVEEILLWAFKTSLLGCVAQRLYGKLKEAVFGETVPTVIEVNLGVLKKDIPNILLYGYFSPLLKLRIGEAAKKRNVSVMGVCTDPLLPPYSFSPVTNYGSQEIPLMTGAVDLIVTGDQFVNPSLTPIAQDYEVPIIQINGLKKEKDLESFAKQIVERAKKSFEFRRQIPKDIPEVKEAALMGFSPKYIDPKKILTALLSKKIRGIAILSGGNNVKYTQDREIVTIAEEFLKNDILCIAEGDASVSLAKYGFLNPSRNGKDLGQGISDLFSSLGKNVPTILDFGSSENGTITQFLLHLVKAGKKELKEYPIFACFAEANRSSEVTEAMWTVAMGISTFFWPALPVTGSPKTMEALSQYCHENFGSRLHMVTDKKMEPRAKAALMIKNLEGAKGPRLSGYPWKAK